MDCLYEPALATDWLETPSSHPTHLPAPDPVPDYELRLVELRLERLRDAERRERLGQGYPTASPLYRIMRGDTGKTAIGGLNRVEYAAMTLSELESEIHETKEAIKLLPDYLKLPITLAYLDPRKIRLRDKRPKHLSERKFFEDLKSAKHRLVGMLL